MSRWVFFSHILISVIYFMSSFQLHSSCHNEYQGTFSPLVRHANANWFSSQIHPAIGCNGFPNWTWQMMLKWAITTHNHDIRSLVSRAVWTDMKILGCFSSCLWNFPHTLHLVGLFVRAFLRENSWSHKQCTLSLGLLGLASPKHYVQWPPGSEEIVLLKHVF